MIYSSLNSACLITSVLMMAKYSNCQVCACNAGAGCGENRLFITECSTTLGRTGKNSMYLKCLSGSQGISYFNSLGDFKKICNIFYKSKI